MRKKKKVDTKLEVEDKRIGSRRALVYGEKRFFYTTSDEKRIAQRKIIAWQALQNCDQGDKK